MPDLRRIGVKSSSKRSLIERRRFSRRRNKRHIKAQSLRSVLLLIIEILVVIALSYLLVSAFGKTIEVPEESMEPTLSLGDEVLVDRVSLRVRSPKTNDVVVFLPAGNLSAQYSIKRVIGVPNDTVAIKGGLVYVNNEAFLEVAEVDEIVSAGLAQDEITLGDNEYFLLGDNRNNSEDSRYATIGNISGDELLGIVWLDITGSNFGLVH